MAEGTYEYECMRAELLGLSKPDEEEFLARQKERLAHQTEELEDKTIEVRDSFNIYGLHYSCQAGCIIKMLGYG